jgi:hypothetical protein
MCKYLGCAPFVTKLDWFGFGSEMGLRKLALLSASCRKSLLFSKILHHQVLHNSRNRMSVSRVRRAPNKTTRSDLYWLWNLGVSKPETQLLRRCRHQFHCGCTQSTVVPSHMAHPRTSPSMQGYLDVRQCANAIAWLHRLARINSIWWTCNKARSHLAFKPSIVLQRHRMLSYTGGTNTRLQ